MDPDNVPHEPNELSSHADDDRQRAHRARALRKRIVPIILLIAAVICTLFLARWQWERFTSASGTMQNLGYALQWPVFGIFFIVIYRKYLQYEREMEEEGELLSQKFDDTQREVPADFLPPIAGQDRGDAGEPLPSTRADEAAPPTRRRLERRDDGLDHLREKRRRSRRS